MPLNAGDLVHSVDLVKDTITRINGVEQKTPTTYASGVRARVTYLAGNEAWKAHQMDASINVEVLMRYRTDVQSSHRVVFRGRTLEIVAPPILDEIRREEVTLRCRG